MKLKTLGFATVAIAMAGFAGSAAAGVDVHIGLGIPGPVYYDAGPSYYYEYEPRPVYRYYAPRPVYNYYYQGHRHTRWCRHDGYRHGGYWDDHGHRGHGKHGYRHHRD